ncbi:hypothetical protein [Hoyosella altamirensis]|uniref:Uncharacterized protein n=1 Tax=Hoyosella altamirensis TaxID=616997 RepID=A0A839RSF3_9ACTN|nr:hypothetical protein [Hoyosella altamirensis]MBB3039138.1 hypothetical protein [Hoyosella altamirensis]
MAALASACSDGKAELGGPAPSGVAGIPVPEHAENTAITVWTLPESDYEDLIGWFDKHLPAGERLNELDYCVKQELATMTAWHWWEAAAEEGSPREWLSVILFDEEPARVEISQTDDGDPRCN